MTQQLLPIAGALRKDLRPDISGLGKLKYLSVPSGNWFFAVLRSKSFSFGTSSWEPLSLPSSGASQEENPGTEEFESLLAAVSSSARPRRAVVCPGLS